MALPILYKQSGALKKVISWEIRIIKVKANYFLQTFSGQVGGKIMEGIQRPVKGKAKRTDEEQATSEALSRWTAKKKKEGYSEKISDASAPPIRPMLAKTYAGPKSKIKFPIYIQPKLDGARCISHRHDGKIILESRTGIHFQHLNEIEREIAKLLKNHPSIYLDGELYSPNMKFEEIMGAIKKTTGLEKASEEDKERMNNIQYYVYDCFDINNLALTMTERLAILNKIFTVASSASSGAVRVKKVDTDIAKTKEDIQAAHDAAVAIGYEGLILRTMDGTYELDKRSSFLQKVKVFEDHEYEIIGFKESPGEPGIIIWRCKTNKGGEFDVVQNGTKDFQRKLYLAAKKNPEKYIGSMLTVMHFGFTDDCIPRMPKGKAIRLIGI